jgi:hypothetical protein
MRRDRLAGLCVLVALAVCAIGAASASAAAPEFGRCIKKAKAEGSGYSNAGCTTAVGSGAKFEWSSGPGPKAHFTVKARFVASTKTKRCFVWNEEVELGNTKHAEELLKKWGYTEEECLKTIKENSGEGEGKEPVVLQPISGERVECSGLSASGEYTSAKTVGAVSSTFTGCEVADTSITCQSGATAGEITTSTLDGELGFEKQESPPTSSVPAIDLFPASGTVVAEFNCGGFASVVVTGSVIHDVTGNKMLLEENEKFNQRGGVQEPTKLEGLPADVLESSTNGGEPVQSGEGLLSTIANEEKIEVSTIL